MVRMVLGGLKTIIKKIDMHHMVGKRVEGKREREKRKSTIIVLDPIWYYFIGCLMGYLLIYDSFIHETLYVQLI